MNQKSFIVCILIAGACAKLLMPAEASQPASLDELHNRISEKLKLIADIDRCQRFKTLTISSEGSALEITVDTATIQPLLRDWRDREDMLISALRRQYAAQISR